MKTSTPSFNAILTSESGRISEVLIAPKEQAELPFITYNKSAEEAVKDLDQISSIRNFLDKMYRCQDTKDLKAILKSHVKQKKGEEATFIRELGFMYGLTKLLTAIGFPKEVRESMKAFRLFNTARGFIRLNYQYHVDTYERQTFSSPPGSGSDEVVLSEEQVRKRKNLSMMLGMLMGVLKDYDRFKDEVRSRYLALGSTGMVLSAPEQRQLDQCYDDCYYLTKGLLGSVTHRIDDDMIARQ